jgi:hypothetical protein
MVDTNNRPVLGICRHDVLRLGKDGLEAFSLDNRGNRCLIRAILAAQVFSCSEFNQSHVNVRCPAEFWRHPRAGQHYSCGTISAEASRYTPPAQPEALKRKSGISLFWKIRLGLIVAAVVFGILGDNWKTVDKYFPKLKRIHSFRNTQ